MQWLAVTCLMATGCAATTAAVTGAVVNTAVAATASGVSRANGGCYAACPEGTTCDGATGLCQALRCRGRCAPDETCVGTGLNEHCERQSSLEIQGDGTRPAYLPPPNNLPSPEQTK